MLLRLKESLESLIAGNGGEEGSWERTLWEIEGSIFSLLTLFLLVALSSFTEIDSRHLFSGRLDHMNNLGGIVGAVVAEWVLGSVGIAGYSIVFISGWLSFSSFREIPFKNSLVKIVGTTMATILISIACFLFFHDQSPAIGRTAFKRFFWHLFSAHRLFIGSGHTGQFHASCG